MNTKIKIAFVIESLNLGGAETGLLSFINNLNNEKYEIDLILFNKNSFFEKYVSNEINIIFLNYPKLNLIDRFLYKIHRLTNRKRFHNAQLFWKIIKNKCTKFEKEYDVIHAFNQGFATYFTSFNLKGRKKFAWINIDYQKANYNINFDFEYYSKFDKIITISEEVDRGFKAELKNNSKKIETKIIKLFVDPNLIRKRGAEEYFPKFQPDKIKIVTVCRLTKQKGLDMAVNACKILVSKGYDLEWFIVGEGIERAFLENLINKNVLQQHIKLIGIKDNPYPFVKNADIYVQTSIFEGLGLTVVEAAMLHKPIVCTNFPTAYEILKDKVTGLIVEMNIDGISNGVEKIILNSELSFELIKNLIDEEYTDMDKSLKLFEELI